VTFDFFAPYKYSYLLTTYLLTYVLTYLHTYLLTKLNVSVFINLHKHENGVKSHHCGKINLCHYLEHCYNDRVSKVVLYTYTVFIAFCLVLYCFVVDLLLFT